FAFRRAPARPGRNAPAALFARDGGVGLSADGSRVSAAPCIRLTGPMDAALLAGLHAPCFPPVRAWGPAALASLLGTPGTFGFLLSPGPATEPDGLALIRMAADEAEILTLGLKPERRGRGLAPLLLEAVVAMLEANAVTSLFLEVAVDNEAA